jgi:hypothetical protein
MTLTFDPKINRGHLLAQTNAPTKFEGQQPMGCQVIDWKLLLPTRSIWPWPLTPKSIGVIYKTNAPVKFEGQRPMSCWVITFGNWKPFWHSRSIELRPEDPKHNRVIFWSWPMFITSLKFLGLSVLYRKPFGQRTDRQTQSNISPLLWMGA